MAQSCVPLAQVPEADFDPSTPLFAVTAAADSRGCIRKPCGSTTGSGSLFRGARPGPRRYSLVDIQQLKDIAVLSAQGMSLPAIARLIALENEVNELCNSLRDMHARLMAELENDPGVCVFAAGSKGVVKLSSRQCNPRSIEIVLRASVLG